MSAFYYVPHMRNADLILAEAIHVPSIEDCLEAEPKTLNEDVGFNKAL